MSTSVTKIPKHIIDDGKVYQRIEDELFEGYSQVLPEVPKVRPYLNWIGPKLTLESWRHVAAFFKWAYDDSKSEVQVRLYFHKENGVWKPWAFPQKHGTGMTTTELPEEEGNERVKAGIAKGWVEGGTIHSHCSATAFQSGTDKENERTKNGVHITIGKIDKDEYDIHGRVSFRGTFYEIAWYHWFEMPEGLEGLPFKFRDQVMQYFLTRAVPDGSPFPDEWKKNVIKQSWSGGGYQGGYRGHNTSGFRTPQGHLPWGEHYGAGSGNGSRSGSREDDDRGVVEVPSEFIPRGKRSKKEKKQLRKELKANIARAERVELNDADAARVNETAIEVIKMCSGYAIDVDELFILTYRDARFLDTRDDLILDDYEAILKKAGVLSKDVEDWIHELTIAGLDPGGSYAGEVH